MLQVPPDFYIPEFDEDEQNPDERVDRKWKIPTLVQTLLIFIRMRCSSICYLFLLSFFLLNSSLEHSQDKHIQRDDEYYDGDNDNDHNLDDMWNRANPDNLFFEFCVY